MMEEFKLVSDFFEPHSIKHDGAFNLKDDAAIFSCENDKEIVITKDALIANVHFFENDNPDDIAYKAFATNISDLAAMGAKPKYYLLAIMLPKETNANFMAKFSDGIGQILQEFGGSLIGGDTIFHDGKLSISVTAIGEVAKGKYLKKSGAKVGDNIYVSGTIGDSYLGLQILLGKLDFSSDYLINRYYRPSPKVDLGIRLIDKATSCTDISDGLIADLDHICDASNVSAKLYMDKIPLSDDARKSGCDIESLVNGGDDYELLFTLPEGVKPPCNTSLIGEIRIC